ncbi:hypothetical protein ACJQWK_06857 [Exserohilum turcicum]
MSFKQPSPASPKPRTRTSNHRAARKGKAVDLERVRNNQRRCRARQKEYIARLEDQIRQYEDVGIEHRANQQIESLTTENRLLKRLL